MTFFQLQKKFLTKYNYNDDPNLDHDFLELLFSYSHKVKDVQHFYLYRNQPIDFEDRLTSFYLDLFLVCNCKFPAAYLTHNKSFYNYQFLIRKGALVPRPETELLVDKIILENFSKIKILDLCAGIGNIGLSLAKSLNAKVTLVEKYEIPFHLMKLNAKKLKVQRQVHLKQEDVKLFLITNKQKYDVVVMNPPYISTTSKDVEKSVLKYEPHSALFARNNGLYFYQLLLTNLPYLMNKKIKVYLEIDPSLVNLLTKLLERI
ncbi:HemK family protein methyltransferase [bacterium]|nr:HemK family protein methyltransferase [bacterium]MBP5783172.1 HemK family protein methyltransferase [bacterium]